jgi:hypothetical protein
LAAKKNIHYQAFINYGSDEVIARVADMNSVKKTELEKMGFEVEYDEGTSEGGVTGKKTSLDVSRFSNTRDGEARVSDGKVASAMINVFQMIFSNQAFVEQVGPRQLLQRFNELLNWAGVPGQWRFDAASSGANNPQQAQEQVNQMAALVQKTVQGEIGQFSQSLVDKVIKPLKEQQDQAAQSIEAISQAFQQQVQQGQQIGDRVGGVEAALAGLIQKLGQIMTPPSAHIPPMMPDIPPDMVQAPMIGGDVSGGVPIL